MKGKLKTSSFLLLVLQVRGAKMNENEAGRGEGYYRKGILRHVPLLWWASAPASPLRRMALSILFSLAFFNDGQPVCLLWGREARCREFSKDRSDLSVLWSEQPFRAKSTQQRPTSGLVLFCKNWIVVDSFKVLPCPMDILEALYVAISLAEVVVFLKGLPFIASNCCVLSNFLAAVFFLQHRAEGKQRM